jgi:hypothetical protein
VGKRSGLKNIPYSIPFDAFLFSFVVFMFSLGLLVGLGEAIST